ncbi:MAG TPA: twin-arginine translocation signal domain-containing protein [Nitrolancea sp.]|nr:twin-arginine translocation signal domain-containing protein [Nitrolancea sp.]
MHLHRHPADLRAVVPRDGRIVVPTPVGPRRIGHAHFWERAFSRRQFMRGTAATAGLALSAGLIQPAGAFSPSHPIFGNADPKPIPGGTDLYALLGLGSGPIFHFFFPAFGQEVSTITDFVGHVGAAEVQGTGTLTNTASTETSTLTFDADMRFMDGLYVAEDGRPRRGTFGFI